jgi:hypothetical protein
VLIHAMEKDPEIAKFKHTINTMVDQLQEFAGQVTHLAKEVGTEGRLGGQAIVPGVDGIWAELTRNGTFKMHLCSDILSANNSQSTSWPEISPTKYEKLRL